jgi:DNA polymerase
MNDELSELRSQVEVCTNCTLHKTRLKSVFGEGPKDSKVLFVGLGPGYHENQEGRPFVGAAGKLLDDLLVLSGLKREDVYITNILKCYLPDNKAKDEEIATCTSYLDKQIALIQPKFIIPLGNVAASYLLRKFGQPIAPMRNLHTKIFSISTLFFQTKIIPMYHPAAALRNPGLKSMVREDWRKLGNLI